MGDESKIKINNIKIGIDAANLRRGGGVTHLVELLRAAQPASQGIDRVVIWGGINTLNAIDDRTWIDKRNPPALDKGLLQRTIWQRYHLSETARNEGCNVLFIPGGSYAGNFHPVVNMSRNMLPFEWRELKRYGWSLLTLKLLLLRLTQSRTYKKTDGMIFLTNYAMRVVSQVTGTVSGHTRIIPHGLNPRFNQKPKQQRSISDYNDNNSYRVIYVSIIDQYKHQWHVVKAMAILRQMGYPVVLDLVGPAYPPALKRLNETIDRVDKAREWVKYHGAVPFDALHTHYAQADMGLFASSCENMPNILLETMASGLPIACSNRGPMPEVLGDNGIYFDPEEPDEIVRAIRKLIDDPELRTELANASFRRSQSYSWQRCANETFEFLNYIASNNKAMQER